MRDWKQILTRAFVFRENKAKFIDRHRYAIKTVDEFFGRALPFRGFPKKKDESSPKAD